MRELLYASAIVLTVAWHVDAGGFARNEHFVVQVASDSQEIADRAFAEEVVLRASEYRREIAREWLGQQLPPSVGRTFLTVLLTDEKDLGMSWPGGDKGRRYHSVHLDTTRQGALGGTLAHEIAHVVLATRFPHPRLLPAWVSEGVACRYDDDERAAVRRQILEWHASTGNWPDLATLINRQVIPALDRESYAVAASVTDFLLTKGDKPTFLEFASRITAEGLDKALSSSYRIRDVEELESLWQAWASRQLSSAAVASASRHARETHGVQ